MLSAQLAPTVAAVVLFLCATLAGVRPVRKLIEVAEARHELKHGSAGFLQSVGGWSMIAIWLGVTWYLATIVGDWAVSGDLAGAAERSWLRLRIILEILAALSESDS